MRSVSISSSSLSAMGGARCLLPSARVTHTSACPLASMFSIEWSSSRRWGSQPEQGVVDSLRQLVSSS
jgi:hypothetical protein